jgi:hypothetical protein
MIRECGEPRFNDNDRSEPKNSVAQKIAVGMSRIQNSISDKYFQIISPKLPINISEKKPPF